MLPKKDRVPRELIPFILKKGDQKASNLFIVRLKENNKEFSRYRVIISRKFHPKAVVRNKCRRQIYEALRINEKKNGRTGKDIIIIPKKQVQTISYDLIEKDITKNIITL